MTFWSPTTAAGFDEACIGDLVVHEARSAGVAGVVIWGLHRDTADVQAIGLPVFSLGSVPAGPLRLDPRPADALDTATIGNWNLTRDDLVIADDDGVLFVPAARATEVLELAEASATPSATRLSGSGWESRSAPSSTSASIWSAAHRRRR